MTMNQFLPFEKAYDTAAAREIDSVLELLDLSKVQSALLWQLLRRFEISVWFEQDDDSSNPHLTISTFWDTKHVASMPLTELLKHVVIFNENAQDIGRDEEIVALTKLKNLIEQAIASRQQPQQNDVEAAE